MRRINLTSNKGNNQENLVNPFNPGSDLKAPLGATYL
jgi:hypothetical protein